MSAKTSRSIWKKLIVVTFVGAAVVIGYTQFGDSLALDKLAGSEATVRNYQEEHPTPIGLRRTVMSKTGPCRESTAISPAWHD